MQHFTRPLCSLLLCALFACARVPEESARPPIFYPPPPDAPRIQYLTSIHSASDLPRVATPFADFLLGEAEDDLWVWKPYGIAMHGSRLYVCDTVLNNIIVMDMEAGTARLMSTNLGADVLRNPINIAIADDGTKYVADVMRGQVVVFDADDHYVTAWGHPDTVKPCDVAVVGDRLAVADLENDEIEIWDRATGDVIAVYGGPGSGLGQFHAPTNLAAAPDGTLCISETHNFRIQRMTMEGDPISAFGEIGSGYGQFTRPKGVAVDPEGRVYVVDAAFSNVQIFDANNQLLTHFGGPGSDLSNLDLPADVEIVSDPATVALFEPFVAPGHRISHIILVSSQFGLARVNVYGFLDGENTSAAGQ